MIDYKDSGVDIDKGNRFVQNIKRLAKDLPNDGFIAKIGAFSSLFSLANYGSDLVLASTTDGVGTKLKIACAVGKHDTVGIDLVAMNVNDIITTGILPTFFLDYIAYSELEDEVLKDIFSGIVEGLRQSDCALAGGETAQMASMYPKGEYDLAGFCVGVGKQKDLFKDGVKEGDSLIGIASSGFHSNGYSLLRKLFFEVANYSFDKLIGNKTLAEILLEPTVIYVSHMELIRKYIKSAAHITGGGFIENIPRALGDFGCIIKLENLPQELEFSLVQDIGKISTREMFKTFNMGVGFVVVVEESDKNLVLGILAKNNIKAYEIGFVTRSVGVCLE